MSGLTRVDAVTAATILILASVGIALALLGQSDWALVVLFVLVAGVGLLLAVTHRSSARRADVVAARIGRIGVVTTAASGVANVSEPRRHVERMVMDLTVQVGELAIQIEAFGGDLRRIDEATRRVTRDLYDLVLAVEETQVRTDDVTLGSSDHKRSAGETPQ